MKVRVRVGGGVRVTSRAASPRAPRIARRWRPPPAESWPKKKGDKLCSNFKLSLNCRYIVATFWVAKEATQSSYGKMVLPWQETGTIPDKFEPEELAGEELARIGRSQELSGELEPLVGPL